MPSPSLTLLRTQSDARLVALSRAGHERAFEAIVERYRRPLLRAAHRVLPEARAEDALQQALLSAWTALQRGDEVRDLRPWLFRIVHRCSLNLLRVSGYDYDELEESLRITDGGDEELERRAVVRQTLSGLAALPDRQREALLRTAVSGDPQEDVARDLGVSGNALRQLVHRARVSMRAAVTAVTPMPLVHWLAASGGRSAPVAERIAELTAGAAGGGVTATLAKAGTVAVVAGGAVTGPAVIDRAAERPGRGSTAAAAANPPAPAGTATPQRRQAEEADAPRAFAGTRPVAGRSAPAAAFVPARRVRRDDDERRSNSGPGRSGRDHERERERVDDDDRSGPGHGSGPPAERERTRRDDEPGDSSGPGSGSRSSGSSGPGPGEDEIEEPDVPELPDAPDPEPEPDKSGSGSGDSDDD